MLRMSTKTKLSTEEAIRRAIEFFGPGGQGLEVKEQGPTCAYFEGGGGGVDVTACAEDGGASLELVSREWDPQVMAFVDKIPH